MSDEKKIRTMIIDDFECLKTDIDSLIDFYKTEAKRYIDENYRDGILLAFDKMDSLLRYKQKIEEMLDELDSIFAEQTVDEQEQNKEDEDFVEIQNFTYAEPLQIKLFNNYYDVNRNWRKVLVTVCEELIKKHPEKFITFDKNPAFKGRTRSYFSYNPEDLIESRKLTNGLYVEMNLSANRIAHICYNLLEQCNYNPEELKFKIEYEEQDADRNNKSKDISKDSEIKLSPKYSSVHISKELFQEIINEIISNITGNETAVFNPVRVSEKLKDIITSKSIYTIPYHVVNKIINYLVDCKLIEKYSKGKYTVKDVNLLKNWLNNV
jgi:hypothetical protein